MKFLAKGLASFLIYSPALFAEPCDLMKSAEADSDGLVKAIVNAVPLERKPPRYPMFEAQKGNEGWTQLSFVVGKDGKTHDVEVINSSGSKWFDQKAISSVKKWTYQPAKSDGEAIEQCQTTVQLDFQMGDSARLSRKSAKRLRRAISAFNEKDWAGLKPYIDDFIAEPSGSFTEQAYMNYIAAEYYREQGNQDLQFHYLLKAVPHNYTPSKYERLPEAQVITGLQYLFVIRLTRNLFFDAKRTFEQLEKIDNELAKKAVVSFRPFYDKIKSTVEGEKAIWVTGEIGNRKWNHNLIRNAFSIQDIKGKLEQLDVRCENKRYIYTVDEKSVWKIPASWGNCQLLVSGDSKTSFKLVELNNDKV